MINNECNKGEEVEQFVDFIILVRGFLTLQKFGPPLAKSRAYLEVVETNNYLILVSVYEKGLEGV